MDPNSDLDENIVGVLNADEKRVWLATYERMQRNGDFTSESIRAGDLAVREFRKRT